MSNDIVPTIRLRAWAEGIWHSYWFLPGGITGLGLLLGFGLVYLDGHLGSAWLGELAWLTGNRPDGAREVLSTIAGSTITVAGVVFSITLAAVTYASGQYGPRLLLNFQRDRGNQVSFGVFLATFVYCLIVLRTIRSAEEASAEAGGAAGEAFVPHIAFYGALLLALASIGVLVYFVHHVTDSIHINNAIARIGKTLLDDIAERKPERPPPAGFDGKPGHEVAADRTGYVEAIDHDALEELACEHGLFIALLRRPGEFVAAGRPLLKAVPADGAEEGVPEGFPDACNDAFAISRKRTPMQDLRFGFDELVEVAARALSPGLNDPFTAITCVDWLGAALLAMDRHPPPEASEPSGGARLFVRAMGFDDYLEAAFGQLRTYVGADPNARKRTLAMLDEIADGVGDPAHRAAVLAERARLAALTPG